MKTKHMASTISPQMLAVIGDAYWKIAVTYWLWENFPDWYSRYLHTMATALTCAEVQCWVAEKNGIALAGNTPHSKSQVFEATITQEFERDPNKAASYIKRLLDFALEPLLKPIPRKRSEDVDDGQPSCLFEALAWDLDVLEVEEGWHYAEHLSAKDTSEWWEATKEDFNGFGKSKGAAQFNALIRGYFK